MGISLNGLTPAGTYPGLIKTGDNTAISGTPKVLSDGNGNDLPMAVSTTGVNFTNQLQQGGVAVPTASQVAAKQDTLVSGTNIKTINGTSVLGSGNIVTPSTPPSGVGGAIQFSAGSAFNSDAANLFWDDTNKRLGVGTNAPTATAHFKGSGTTSATTSLLVQNSAGTSALTVRDDLSAIFGGAAAASTFAGTGYFSLISEQRLVIGISPNRTLLRPSGDGILTILNGGETNFNRLQFGGTTNAFPAIKRNGAGIDFRLADDSGFATISVNNVSGNIGIFGGGVWSSVYRTTEGGIWNVLSGTGINIKATLSTLIAMTGIPTTRPATTGDLYQDTAANILANGDRVIGIRV